MAKCKHLSKILLEPDGNQAKNIQKHAEIVQKPYKIKQKSSKNVQNLARL